MPLPQNKTASILILLGLLTALLLGFQNCEILKKSDGSDSTFKSGNGEPYVGNRPPNGTYYARKQDFTCPSGSHGPAFEEVQGIIDVSEKKDVALYTDNCTGSQYEVSFADLSANEYSQQYIGYDTKIYQQFPQPPQPGEPYPIKLCHSEQVGPFLAMDNIIVHEPRQDIFLRIIQVAVWDIQTNQPVPMVTEPEQVMGQPVEFPPGVPGAQFFRENYNLTVSSFSPDGRHSPGMIQGLIFGVPVEKDALCINPLQ